MSVLKSNLQALVYRNIKEAQKVCDLIGLSEGSVNKYAAETVMVSKLPKYQLKLNFAVKEWATILFVDLRGSSRRALHLGARKTYITMHALLPALAFIVGEFDGYLLGYRGDGLFAAFGINEIGEAGNNRGAAVKSATRCGLTMIEGVREVVNRALDTFQLEAGLSIGVGIDAGEVVITKIGLSGAAEVTAYGIAVNTSSKLCEKVSDKVLLSTTAYDIYPSSVGGKTKIDKYCDNPTGYKVEYPGSYLDD